MSTSFSIFVNAEANLALFIWTTSSSRTSNAKSRSRSGRIHSNFILDFARQGHREMHDGMDVSDPHEAPCSRVRGLGRHQMDDEEKIFIPAHTKTLQVS